ncbi:MAG TPA: peptide chain release factor N(5)-glutamine methyltransferase [Draconibacterium sp.]|nr:peptide chain release factor N(5)-glutamine methyltransferase [Draconibacterium sp.]
MQTTIQYISEELANYYPDSEIRGFVRLIMESVCGLSYTEMILQKDRVPTADKKKELDEIIKRLKTYEPIQYILGETEFFDLKLKVNPNVLIPRPETEELVNWILESEIAQQSKILDIGTGSGCIALALKANLPESDVWGVDISEKALETASNNAKLNKLEVNFRKADILHFDVSNWAELDVVVSNPPYVRLSEKQLMQKNVLDFEPVGALFVPDDDPLLFYRAIAEFSMNSLRKNGFLFLEINEYLGAETVDLLEETGFRNVEIRMDLFGKNRMIRCQK